MKDTTSILFGIKNILTDRWPESLSLLEKIIQKAQLDSFYAETFNDWLRKGSTLNLRELCNPFGDYMASGTEGRDFRNQLNPIDTAHHWYYLEHCKAGYSPIIESIRDTLIEHSPESESLLNQMIQKASDDELYSQKLKSYFTRFGQRHGSTLLRELTSDFSSSNELHKDELGFQKKVDAIDDAHNIVYQKYPTIASLLG